MRGFIGLVIVVVAGLVLYRYFKPLEEEGATAEESSSPKAASAAAVSPAPPSVQPVGAAITPVPIDEIVRAAAKRNRVTITRYQRKGQNATVEFQWTGDVMSRGSEVLDTLIAEGVLIDFEVNNPQLQMSRDRDGRRVMKMQAKLRLRF